MPKFNFLFFLLWSAAFSAWAQTPASPVFYDSKLNELMQKRVNGDLGREGGQTPNERLSDFVRTFYTPPKKWLNTLVDVSIKDPAASIVSDEKRQAMLSATIFEALVFNSKAREIMVAPQQQDRLTIFLRQRKIIAEDEFYDEHKSAEYTRALDESYLRLRGVPIPPPGQLNRVVLAEVSKERVGPIRSLTVGDRNALITQYLRELGEIGPDENYQGSAAHNELIRQVFLKIHESELSKLPPPELEFTAQGTLQLKNGGHKKVLPSEEFLFLRESIKNYYPEMARGLTKLAMENVINRGEKNENLNVTFSNEGTIAARVFESVVKSISLRAIAGMAPKAGPEQLKYASQQILFSFNACLGRITRLDRQEDAQNCLKAVEEDGPFLGGRELFRLGLLQKLTDRGAAPPKDHPPILDESKDQALLAQVLQRGQEAYDHCGYDFYYQNLLAKKARGEAWSTTTGASVCVMAGAMDSGLMAFEEGVRQKLRAFYPSLQEEAELSRLVTLYGNGLRQCLTRPPLGYLNGAGLPQYSKLNHTRLEDFNQGFENCVGESKIEVGKAIVGLTLSKTQRPEIDAVFAELGPFDSKKKEEEAQKRNLAMLSNLQTQVVNEGYQTCLDKIKEKKRTGQIKTVDPTFCTPYVTLFTTHLAVEKALSDKIDAVLSKDKDANLRLSLKEKVKDDLKSCMKGAMEKTLLILPPEERPEFSQMNYEEREQAISAQTDSVATDCAKKSATLLIDDILTAKLAVTPMSAEQKNAIKAQVLEQLNEELKDVHELPIFQEVVASFSQNLTERVFYQVGQKMVETEVLPQDQSRVLGQIFDPALRAQFAGALKRLQDENTRVERARALVNAKIYQSPPPDGVRLRDYQVQRGQLLLQQKTVDHQYEETVNGLLTLGEGRLVLNLARNGVENILAQKLSKETAATREVLVNDLIASLQLCLNMNADGSKTVDLLPFGERNLCLSELTRNTVTKIANVRFQNDLLVLFHPEQGDPLKSCVSHAPPEVLERYHQKGQDLSKKMNQDLSDCLKKIPSETELAKLKEGAVKCGEELTDSLQKTAPLDLLQLSLLEAFPDPLPPTPVTRLTSESYERYQERLQKFTQEQRRFERLQGNTKMREKIVSKISDQFSKEYAGINPSNEAQFDEVNKKMLKRGAYVGMMLTLMQKMNETIWDGKLSGQRMSQLADKLLEIADAEEMPTAKIEQVLQMLTPPVEAGNEKENQRLKNMLSQNARCFQEKSGEQKLNVTEYKRQVDHCMMSYALDFAADVAKIAVDQNQKLAGTTPLDYNGAKLCLKNLAQNLVQETRPGASVDFPLATAFKNVLSGLDRDRAQSGKEKICLDQISSKIEACLTPLESQGMSLAKETFVKAGLQKQILRTPLNEGVSSTVIAAYRPNLELTFETLIRLKDSPLLSSADKDASPSEKSADDSIENVLDTIAEQINVATLYAPEKTARLLQNFKEEMSEFGPKLEAAMNEINLIIARELQKNPRLSADELIATLNTQSTWPRQLGAETWRQLQEELRAKLTPPHPLTMAESKEVKKKVLLAHLKKSQLLAHVFEAVVWKNLFSLVNEKLSAIDLVDEKVRRLLREAMNPEKFHQLFNLSGSLPQGASKKDLEERYRLALREFENLNRSLPRDCSQEQMGEFQEKREAVVETAMDNVRFSLRELVENAIEGKLPKDAKMDSVLDQLKGKIVPYVLVDLVGPVGSPTPLAQEIFAEIVGRQIREKNFASWYYGDNTLDRGWIYDTNEITPTQVQRALQQTPSGKAAFTKLQNFLTTLTSGPNPQVNFDQFKEEISDMIEQAFDEEKAQRKKP